MRMLIGGGMAYTFLKSQGMAVGKSLVEADKTGSGGGACLRRPRREISGCCCPPITWWARSSSADTQTRTVPVSETPDGWMGLDIGPETVRRFSAEIARAKTIVWNGPMGVFEMPAFARGTMADGQGRGRGDFAGRDVDCRRRAIRWRRCIRQGWPTRFRTSRRAAALRWSFWPGKKLPGVEALTDKA